MKIEDKDNNYHLKINSDGSINTVGGSTPASLKIADGVDSNKLVTVVSNTDGTYSLQTTAVASTAAITVLSGTAGNLLSQVSGTVTAVSGTAANLLSQVSGTVTAVSGTASNLLAQVSNGTAANLLSQVSGTVTAVSGTAANLLSQVSGTVTAVSGTAANLLSQVSGTVTAVSGTAANLLSQVSGTVTAVSGTAGNLLATVSQGTAANLLATVSCGTAANLLATVSSSTAADVLTVSQGTASRLNATVVVTAGTAVMGQCIVADNVTALYNGTASISPLYAVIATTATGDNTIVSAVASKKIYVLSGVLMANAATNVKFWSTSSAGTAITGLMCLPASGGFQIPYTPVANFATQATNQALVLNMSAAATLGGWITYVAY